MNIKKKFMAAAFPLMVLFGSHAFSDVAGGTITGLIVPAGSNDVVSITFSNTNNKCDYNRVKFSKSDKELYSYVLSLYVSGKSVAFYFNPNGGSLGGIPGHGLSTCELESIWSDGA